MSILPPTAADGILYVRVDLMNWPDGHTFDLFDPALFTINSLATTKKNYDSKMDILTQFMFAGFINHVEQGMLLYGETTAHQVSLIETYNMPRTHNYNEPKCVQITNALILHFGKHNFRPFKLHRRPLNDKVPVILFVRLPNSVTTRTSRPTRVPSLRIKISPSKMELHIKRNTNWKHCESVFIGFSS